MLTSLINKNSLSPSLQMMTKINNEQVKELNKFKTMFSDIENIKVGDKIGKQDNKYYIQEAGPLQKFKRWWYNENRSKTFDDLTNDFTNFFKLCDKIKTNNFFNKQTKKDVVSLVAKMIPGLYNLKTIYKDCEKESEGNKLSLKIDSIILTLIDFKQEINHNDAITSITTLKARTLSF